jgi:hypothetical protein
MPRFSIILIHYQGTKKHTELCRGVASLVAQTCQDFEILAYHDGPLLDPSLVWPIPFKCSPVRYNDWGHTLRDIGMREAQGEYILHFNCDNILYPNALEEIASAITRPPRIVDTTTGQALDTNDIIVFAIIQRGYHRFRDALVQFADHPEYSMILTGNPPRVRYVDAMQFVMRRSLWLAEGGWYDKSFCGDGYMYEKFAWKYGYRSVEKILGEHF